MLTYHHILVATDLSEKTDAVAEAAHTMASKAKAKLSIVYVLEHTPIVYGGGEFSIPIDINLEEQLGINASKALEAIGKRYHIPKDQQHIAHGSVKREIIELAQKLGIDLIVVGSHGHNGLEILLGSTANAILHAAKCDVLAVRTATSS